MASNDRLGHYSGVNVGRTHALDNDISEQDESID